MNWLVRAVMITPRVWATLCWQRVLDMYALVRSKSTVNEIANRAAADAAAAATDIQIADALTIENVLTTILALVTRMRIGYLS